MNRTQELKPERREDTGGYAPLGEEKGWKRGRGGRARGEEKKWEGKVGGTRGTE